MATAGRNHPARFTIRRGTWPPLLRPIFYALGAILPLLMIFHSLGGYCYGPRYWVALLPFLAVGVVLILDGAPRWARWWTGLLAAVAALLAVAASFVYTSVWDTLQGAALVTLARRLF